MTSVGLLFAWFEATAFLNVVAPFLLHRLPRLTAIDYLGVSMQIVDLFVMGSAAEGFQW